MLHKQKFKNLLATSFVCLAGGWNSIDYIRFKYLQVVTVLCIVVKHNLPLVFLSPKKKGGGGQLSGSLLIVTVVADLTIFPCHFTCNCGVYFLSWDGLPVHHPHLIIFPLTVLRNQSCRVDFSHRCACQKGACHYSTGQYVSSNLNMLKAAEIPVK